MCLDFAAALLATVRPVAVCSLAIDPRPRPLNPNIEIRNPKQYLMNKIQNLSPLTGVLWRAKPRDEQNKEFLNFEH